MCVRTRLNSAEAENSITSPGVRDESYVIADEIATINALQKLM